MAANSDFIAAAYPEPWQVLGVKLRPFSIGHYLKLSRLNCAFVCEEKTDASLGDLLLAVVVCSMPTSVDSTQDKFWQWLQRDKGGILYTLYKIKQKIFRRKIATPAEYDVYLWGKNIGAVDYPSKIAMLQKYIEENSIIPVYVETPNDSPKASGAHWVQSVLTCLVSKCGYTQEEALNVPMSKALADYIKQAEIDGAVTILPTEAVQ